MSTGACFKWAGLVGVLRSGARGWRGNRLSINILAALCQALELNGSNIISFASLYFIELTDLEACCLLPSGGSTRAPMTSRTRSPSEPSSTYHNHDLEPGSYTALRLVHIAYWSFRYLVSLSNDANLRF